jgi:MFS family permease
MHADHQMSRIYRRYVLLLLMITYVFSFMDRQILAILIEDIGAEFALNDTERGLLLGPAFALFYSVLGIPIAWLADRSNRKNIIAVSITIWSAATALSALATGFASMLLARVFVGVGEAGGTPPAHSILADYFPESKLSRALSIYSLGPLVGGTMAFVGGGWLGEEFGWRTTLIILGTPGLLIGAIVYFTIQEPKRGALSQASDDSSIAERATSSWRSLLSNAPFLGTVSGYALQSVTSSAIVAWAATVLIRTHELSMSDAGLLLGISTLAGPIPGMLIGGHLADILGAKTVRWRAWLPAFALSTALPFYALAMIVPSAKLSATMLAFGGFFVAISIAPSLGIIQMVVRPNQRARASAVLLLAANLFGVGIGPLFAGWLSDQLEPLFDAFSLNLALAILSLSLIPASFAYYWASRNLQ